MKNSILLMIFLISGLLFSQDKNKETEKAVKKETAGDVWVCRHYTGGPQCMDELDMKDNSVNSLKPKNENALAALPPTDVTLENAADKLRENGVTALETKKFNYPVCAACYQCPKYSIDLCFRVDIKDLEKVQKLGFTKKEIKKDLPE